MKRISQRIQYLPASADYPLSADVYCIDGNEYCYIYDVGSNADALHYIDQIEKEKIVILSHHHKDHTGNIDSIPYRDLYVGKEAREVIGKGSIVEDRLTINDGVKIEVLRCTSPHTDGSLVINIDNKYTLIADLYFTRPPFDKEKAAKMLDELQDIHTKYFVISHQEEKKNRFKRQIDHRTIQVFLL